MAKFMLIALTLLINIESDQTVYLCDSPHARSYHLKETCRGLSNCSHRVVKLSLTEAKKKGKALCRWEM